MLFIKFVVMVMLTCKAMLYAQGYVDKNPSTIVESDVEFLREFEDKVYGLSLHVKNYDDRIMQVVSYVRAHSIYNEVMDTNWKIDFRARTGLIAGRTSEETENHREEVGLVFTYPLLDAKEKKERIEKRMTRESSSIDNIKEYFAVIKDLSNLEIEEQYYRMVELRQKVREKKGIINLDDRLDTIKKLIDIKAKMEGFKIKKFELKEKILLMVHSNNQVELEKLLNL